jgi:hypothetical protein
MKATAGDGPRAARSGPPPAGAQPPPAEPRALAEPEPPPAQAEPEPAEAEPEPEGRPEPAGAQPEPAEAESEPVGAEPGPGGGAGFGRRWLWIFTPIAVYAVTRAVQLLLIDWMLPPEGSVRDKLLSWDGGWFVRVAEEGYPHGYAYDADGVVTGNGLAFFPGYPWLIRLAHAALRLDYGDAAIVIAWLAAAVAAVLVYALGAALWNDRVATALTVLVCTQPMSVVLSMGYSEALFIALVAGSLLAAYRHRWLVAGLLGLAAGLTRPTGVALAAALAVAALVHVGDPEHGPRRWRALVGAAIAMTGVPAYLAWVAYRVGEPDAWFTIQTAGWGTKFDYGRTAARFIYDALRAGDGWVHVSVAWMLMAAVVAAVLAVRASVWPPLIVYGLVALTLVVGQAGYYHSKPRLLVPVLLTLVPAAVALGRARSRTMVAVLVGFAFFGLWYGAYLITVWRYAI